MLQCLLCKKYFRHLGSHIWHRHKMLARDYKAKFELPYSEALITDEIKEKKNRKALAKPTWQKNFVDAEKFQFKKGHSGFRRVSAEERRKYIARIKEVNQNHKTFKACPVCHISYKHLESHLFNKHGFIQVKKN